MATTPKRLLDEGPLLLLPSLAREVGVTSSIHLQQVHYRCVTDGVVWATLPVESASAERDWTDELAPFSGRTIRRTFEALEGRGLLVAEQCGGYDQTKRRRVDYLALRKLLPHAQIGPMDASRSPADRPGRSGHSGPISRGSGEEEESGESAHARTTDEVDRARRRRNHEALLEIAERGAT